MIIDYDRGPKNTMGEDETNVQMAKLVLGVIALIGMLFILTVLYKIDKLEAQQVEQGQEIINLLSR